MFPDLRVNEYWDRPCSLALPCLMARGRLTDPRIRLKHPLQMAGDTRSPGTEDLRVRFRCQHRREPAGSLRQKQDLARLASPRSPRLSLGWALPAEL